RIEAVPGGSEGGTKNLWVEFQIPIQGYDVQSITITVDWLRDLTVPYADHVLAVFVDDTTLANRLLVVGSGLDGQVKSETHTVSIPSQTEKIIIAGNVDYEAPQGVFHDSYLYYTSIIINGTGRNPFLSKYYHD